MRLFSTNAARSCFAGTARKIVGLAVLLFFALPFGLSVVGCGSKVAPPQYCTAGDTGPVVGQVATVSLSSATIALTGISLNYGQIGPSLAATGLDCKGNTVAVKSFTYASTSSFTVNASGGEIIADINPTNGQMCGGTWNRNTGGGIPNYTTCTPPPAPPTNYLAFVTATGNGVVSQPVAVYVHPVVTGIELGGPTPGAVNGACPAGTADPGTDCCPNDTVGVPIAATVYTGGCVSQNQSQRLVARIYQGGIIDAAHNITCQVGHIGFTAQSASIVTIDPATGLATANQPGSSVITATISNSSTGTQAGFFSTCPPASITLSFPGTTSTTANVGINNTQPFTATVLDTAGNPISSITGLEYVSTTPQTIPASVGSVTPVFPGSADITAVCLPSSCNPSPFSQIGLPELPVDVATGTPVSGGTPGGNGKPITSNPLTVNAVGASSTVIYMGSTQSQYIQPRDFTTNQPGALIKLPYVPNSMVINQAGSSLFLGSSKGLMTITTASNILGTVNQAITGVVLSVSPDGSTLVISDPQRQTISLANASGSIFTSYGGVATHAVWSPDAQAVYVTTTTGTVLVHTNFTDWQVADSEASSGEIYTDVVSTVPSIGAFFAGPKTTDGRSYCSTSTPIVSVPAVTPQKVSNEFIPIASQTATATDRVAATTDGDHILGAHANTDGTAVLSDIDVAFQSIPGKQPDGPGVCTNITGPAIFTTTTNNVPLTGISAVPDATVYVPTVGTPLGITGVVPSSNSAVAAVTYTGRTLTGNQALLPLYFPPATGKGSLTLLPLNAPATAAPVAGVFSTDNFSLYVGTDGGDNQVHIITFTYPTGAAPTATETGVITPNLPNANGATSSPVNLLTQFPKKSTS